MGFMTDIPNEDRYWEMVREKTESPRRCVRDRWEYDPVIEKKSLYLDCQIDDIEEKTGYSVEDFTEDELCEIVRELVGIEAGSAEWDPRFLCIKYTYQVA